MKKAVLMYLAFVKKSWLDAPARYREIAENAVCAGRVFVSLHKEVMQKHMNAVQPELEALADALEEVVSS